jgi:uncharacterized membrane protein
MPFSSWLGRGVWLVLALYASSFIIPALLAPLLANTQQFDAAGWCYNWLAQACHQRPSATLWLVGYPMGVCSRCAGVYAASALWAWLGFIQPKGHQVFHSPWVVAGLAFIAFLDKFLYHLTQYQAPTVIRLVAGLALGWLIGLAISLAGQGLIALWVKLNSIKHRNELR